MGDALARLGGFGEPAGETGQLRQGQVEGNVQGSADGAKVEQGGVGVGYGAFIFASAENAPYFSVDWTRANVSSRGPLGAHYRVWGDGKQMVPNDRFDYFGLAGQSSAELRAKDGERPSHPPYAE